MKTENIYCIIMAGGLGTRFWPMCTRENPKQFMDIMGTGESMLQNTFHRFEKVCPKDNIIVVTGSTFVSQVREHLPGLKDYQVLGEPMRRNTAPCVAYAASVIKHINPEATIIVTPSDHAIFGQHQFEQDLRTAAQLASEHDWIITLGVRPTNPNSKFGYIQFAEESSIPDNDRLHSVVTFTEKPPVEVAREFIATGEFFWNAGIFVWNLKTMKKAYEDFLPSIAESFTGLTHQTPASEVESIYSTCESVSADIGIMEKADNVHVLETSFSWSDVETWDSLYSTVKPDESGNVILSGNIFTYDVKDSVVHVPAKQTLVLQGLEGYIVAGNDDVLMICRRDQEDSLFKFASDIEMRKEFNAK